MTAVLELPRTAKLIPTWQRDERPATVTGRGDLTIVLKDGGIYLHAAQFEALAGIPPWAQGETLLGDDWPLELDGHPYYRLDDAIARAEAQETAQSAAFLAWLTKTMDELLTEEALEHAHTLPSFMGSYPVRRAAEILSRDPGIDIGMHGLFEHMRLQGWIERDDPHTDWRITTTGRLVDWLTIRDVLVPAPTKVGRRSYPQIYVTPGGLAQLRRTLHAINSNAPPEPEPAPTLF